MRLGFRWSPVFVFCLLLVTVLFAGPEVRFLAAEDKPAKPAAKEEKLPNVVARVNGVDIEAKLVQFQLNRLMRMTGRPIRGPQKQQVIKDIIDKEVVRELVYQEGKSQNLLIDDSQVDQQLELLRKPYPSEKEFGLALAERGITLDELKQSIKVDLVAKKLLDDKVKGKIQISDADVKDYYENNKTQFFRPEAFRARHIFISVFPPELLKEKEVFELQEQEEKLRAEAEKKVKDIHKQLKDGGDFAELAKKYSHDAATAGNGGDLDFMYKGVFDPAFDEAVGKLKPGEMSDVVKTEFGYHIIKLMETKPGEQAPFSEMEPAIQRHLFMEKAQGIVHDYLAGLKKKANIEILF